MSQKPLSIGHSNVSSQFLLRVFEACPDSLIHRTPQAPMVSQNPSPKLGKNITIETSASLPSACLSWVRIPLPGENMVSCYRFGLSTLLRASSSGSY